MTTANASNVIVSAWEQEASAVEQDFERMFRDLLRSPSVR
jgi:hypothetical protein